jgi:hypothetical protein
MQTRNKPERIIVNYNIDAKSSAKEIIEYCIACYEYHTEEIKESDNWMQYLICNEIHRGVCLFIEKELCWIRESVDYIICEYFKDYIMDRDLYFCKVPSDSETLGGAIILLQKRIGILRKILNDIK